MCCGEDIFQYKKSRDYGIILLLEKCLRKWMDDSRSLKGYIWNYTETSVSYFTFFILSEIGVGVVGNIVPGAA